MKINKLLTLYMYFFNFHYRFFGMQTLLERPAMKDKHNKY